MSDMPQITASTSTLRTELRGAIASTLVSFPLSITIGIIAVAPLGKDYVIQGALAGIFGAIILGFVSALLGARTMLISGPRASSALIVASLISQLYLSKDIYFSEDEAIGHVLSLAFFAILLAGMIQLVGGTLRIGNIVKYIPYPVIAGFVNSTALLIIMGQIWNLLGIERGTSITGRDSFLDLMLQLNEYQPLTMIPGLVTIAVMMLVARKIKFLPASLTGVTAGTAVYHIMKETLKSKDIGATLGNISGESTLDFQLKISSLMPSFNIPDMYTGILAGSNLVEVLVLILPAAFSMAVLASLDTAVSLSQLDDLSQKRTRFNRELIGHGAGNMVSAMFGGLIGAGGMVRTIPGFDAGGRTNAMAIMVSALMLLVIFLFWDYIVYIPNAVVAAMIIVLGVQIFDRWSLSIIKTCFTRHDLKQNAALMDVGVIVLVVAVALIFDLITAVGIGTFISIIIFASRMSRSIIRNVYRGPAIQSRNMWDFNLLEILKANGHKIAVIELEGSLFFGTAENLESKVDDLVQDQVKYIILDAKRVNDIDSTGARTLQRIQDRLRKYGGKLGLSYVVKERRLRKQEFDGQNRRIQSSSRHIWQYLENIGTVKKLGKEVFFPDTDSALTQFEKLTINARLENQRFKSKLAFLPAILKNLTRRDIRILRRLATRHFFKKGETVFKQGDAGDAIFYVSKGRANIFLEIHSSGEKKRLYTLMSGTVFGEMAVLDAKPRAASVVAAEDTICYRLSITEFEHIKSYQHEIALKLMNNICQMFSERIRSANTMIAELEN
jgi:MFS superfamily sulfate permease-like transporter/CRP-like cAMP-binding protein